MSEWESSDYEPGLPVTEKSNPRTRDLDRAPAGDVLRMLQACDAEMFQPETETAYQRFSSVGVVGALVELAERVQLILKDPLDSLIVLSGCGTSGRLAFLLASGFNRALRQLDQSPVYSYIIAGGDRALLSSQEAPEDDPELGTLSLKQACEGKRRVLFIGISCGLSAPFVAAQLDFCLQHPEVFTPVLVGFNPAHQARAEPIPGCSFTFLSVAQRMQERARRKEAFLINPAVGPEAVSGSSRMKGGSATKILLEVVLSAAHTTAATKHGILQHIKAYEETVDFTYSQREELTAVVEAAGHSLLGGGRVCYLGWGSPGVLGLIDASECVPTFGADYEDIRGFISGGFKELSNNEGPLTSLGPEFCISHEDFLLQVLPRLSDRDTVLLIYSQTDDGGQVAAMARRVREKTSSLHAVVHRSAGGPAEVSLRLIGCLRHLPRPSPVCLPFRRKSPGCAGLCSTSDGLRERRPTEACRAKLTFFSLIQGLNDHFFSLFQGENEIISALLLLLKWEFSTKLVLNAVSTGAHVLKGKIFQNHMMDVQVTNSKLHQRASRLLQKLSGRPPGECEEALLRAIYGVDELNLDITTCDITTHTRVAGKRQKVVPLALICLLTGCSLKEAESRLERRPVVREAVEAVLSM
ncbi:glucokinase regulatory protein [Menidia menidia]